VNLDKNEAVVRTDYYSRMTPSSGRVHLNMIG
jgi:hypothetical protein